MQNQLGKNIKILRSDRGGEYLSKEFDNHLKKCGIVSQLTPPRNLNGMTCLKGEIELYWIWFDQ